MEKPSPSQTPPDFEQRSKLAHAYIALLRSDEWQLWYAQAEQEAAYDVLSLHRDIADGSDVPDSKLRSRGAVWNHIAFAPTRMKSFIESFEKDAAVLVNKQKSPTIDTNQEARGI